MTPLERVKAFGLPRADDVTEASVGKARPECSSPKVCESGPGKWDRSRETKRCSVHPENECHPDAENKCVCTPPGQNPEEWARLTPDERHQRLDSGRVGLAPVLALAVLAMLGRKP